MLISASGNTCFDFMTNDVKGDSTSTDSHELMLWLEYTGGQLPIGWVDGPTNTIDCLFGTSWKLYQGYNTGTGILVSSLLPDTQFDGVFEGDLREWLMAMVDIGLFDETTYVNVGNRNSPLYFPSFWQSYTMLMRNFCSRHRTFLRECRIEFDSRSAD